ncbi:N-terminal methylation [Nautilia profundicola AmH]|uniref:N-terminal methylation n=1 Tax=Nautilia profundicola (strain ATCC BAA-1463 / DSM 18972 / AmH) TaxID=598659 RepID=B9L5X3_NAUPA|nr:prepilin-type N-terminal cleavage/methylation domain-containing protein [Nautilia profundicola]ACM92926.1 N-terminal methylation [Nautilia profundicola AmH]
MKKAFTLIELIFVIVIIGLLAAVAVPKFLNLKQHAEANSVVKTTVDAAQQAVEAAINYRDLEGKEYNLSDLITLKGKNWNWPDNNTTEYNDSGNIVARIELGDGWVNYEINCSKFKDQTTIEKCKNLLGKSSIEANLTY